MSFIVNWTLLLKQVRPFLDLGGLPPASRRGGWGSTPVHSAWYSWRTKRKWYRFFSNNFGFPLSVFFLLLLHVQILFIYHRCVVILATDSCLCRPYMPDHSCYTLNSCITNWILERRRVGGHLLYVKGILFIQPFILNWWFAIHTGRLKHTDSD